MKSSCEQRDLNVRTKKYIQENRLDIKIFEPAFDFEKLCIIVSRSPLFYPCTLTVHSVHVVCTPQGTHPPAHSLFFVFDNVQGEKKKVERTAKASIEKRTLLSSPSGGDSTSEEEN